METDTVIEKSRIMPDQHQLSHLGHYFQRQIWAVGGGKGGVGKSLLASSLGYALARMGHDTLVIDLDLGGANLHTVLGQAPPPKCISDFLSGKVNDLKECIVHTEYPNLSIIAGAKDDLKITQITPETKDRLFQSIHSLKAQFIIFDLGAGTSDYTLDFFNLAQVGILTVLPEPTSIENAYRFLKACYYNRLLENPKFAPIHSLIDAAMNPNNHLGIKSPQHLLTEVHFKDPRLAEDLKRTIKEFRPKLVINQTRSQTDIDVGFSIKSVAKQYFGIDLDFLGYLEYEPNVWQSVRKMRPILAEHPQSRIALHIDRIVNYLLKQAKIEHTLKD